MNFTKKLHDLSAGIDEVLVEFAGAKATLKNHGYTVGNLPNKYKGTKAAVQIMAPIGHDGLLGGYSGTVASKKRRAVGRFIRDEAAYAKKNIPIHKSTPQLWRANDKLNELHELSAKIDVELARGDYAIPALKRAGLHPPGASKEGFNAAMRKNVKDHRSKYNSWMGDNLTVDQAGKQVKAYRDTAAKGLKWARAKDELNGIRTPMSSAARAEVRAMQKYVNAAMAKK